LISNGFLRFQRTRIFPNFPFHAQGSLLALSPQIFMSSNEGKHALEQRSIGSSGMKVTCLGLGCMPLSIDGRPSEEQAKSVIHEALNLGVTLLDTADVYCLDDNDIGHNERLIAKALAEYKGSKDKLIVATKGGVCRPEGRWDPSCSPEHLKKACEKSLKALGVDCIDLYQLHTVDPKVPFEDSVKALAELQKEGKIRHIGLSNVSVDQIQSAQKIVPIVSVQNRLNIFQTEKCVENGVLKFCEEHNIALLAYSPVGGHRGHKTMDGGDFMEKLCSKYQCTQYELMIAALLHWSPVIIPIPGATKLSSIQSSVRAASIKLSQEDFEQLTSPSIRQH